MTQMNFPEWDITLTPKAQSDSDIKRRRFSMKWWVDNAKADDVEITQRLNCLKKSRRYAPTIMDAIRLYFSLQDGYTTILERFFPNIVERIKREGEARLRESIEYERLQLELQTKQELIRMMQSAPRHVETAPTFSISSDYEDSLIEVSDTVTVSAEDIAANFMNSMIFDED